jgi:hypothetical protein
MESGVRNSHTPSVKYGCPEEIFMKPRLFQHCFVKNSYIECHEKPTIGLIADTSLHVAGCTDTVFKKAIFFLLLTERQKFSLYLTLHAVCLSYKDELIKMLFGEKYSVNCESHIL